MYIQKMAKIPEKNKRSYKNFKNKLLLNYFMMKAGNDNKKIKLEIEKLISILAKM